MPTHHQETNHIQLSKGIPVDCQDAAEGVEEAPTEPTEEAIVIDASSETEDNDLPVEDDTSMSSCETTVSSEYVSSDDV